MPVVKDVFDVLVTLIEFIKKGYVDNAEARRAYFANHISESYVKMELIHTDYLTNLNTLLRIQAKQEKSTSEIVQWLKDKKIAFKTARVRAGKIQSEVSNNKYFKKAFKQDTEISRWSLQYMKDIVHYFHHGTNLQMMTWYEFLVSVYERSLFLQTINEANGPVGASSVGTSADIFKEIENTIGTIESQFNFISESYSQLRGLCLK